MVDLLQNPTLRRPRVWLTASLLVSLALIAYSLSPFPGNYLGLFCVLIILYLNLVGLYLREKSERIEQLESQRARWTKALDETNKALQLEKTQRAADFTRRDSKWYQSFSRVLTADDERLFCTVWSQALQIPAEENHLRYLQHRISQIEDLCVGRLAGTIQDAILRTLVACSIQDDSLRLLEIGTLFGIHSIVMYDIASCFFEQVKLTMIDPLDGYYGSRTVDVNTGLPVTRSILQRNLDRLMIPSEHYSIIQQYSSSPTAVRLAGRQSYNYILIDGDHTYEGVKTDFELYSPMLERSGYLVFDDYQTESWPEVKHFVDEVVLDSPVYECLGASWRSIVFRRR